MGVDVIGALSSYSYQSALSQTGSPNKALAQGLAAVQAQVAQAGSLFSSGGSMDPLTALAGSAGQPALASLTTTVGSAAGSGASPVQDLLSAFGGSQDSASSAVSALPWSVAMLSPASAQALVRYAYDQSQNPSHTAAQAAAAGQQPLLASGLNLLA